ncbi:MAG: hypothetical protein CL920_24775 [Deltaproteobacteria bacterium]|nr:hypothetical protein [Deltaproteobacteria bacterium]
MTIQGGVLIAYCILMPVLSIFLARRFAWAKFLGPVLLSCGFGIIVANQPIFAVSTELAAIMTKTSKLISQITIPLAIPLLLFQSDMSDLKTQGKSSIISFFISVFSVFLGTFLVFKYFGGQLGPEGGKQAGMLMSVYIGGIPNLVAVQRAIKASMDSFVIVQSTTMFVSTFYLLFVLTLAKPLLSKIFPAHPDPEPFHTTDELTEADGSPSTLKQKLVHGGQSIGASILCVVISAGITIALTGKAGSLGVVLCITTLAIIGSFWKALRDIPTHEAIGTFFILIFCVSAGTQLNIQKLLASGSLFLTFTLISVVALLIIHYALNRLARIDVDTAITMSMATMFGPPFVPVAVQALDNRTVLLPGMTMGFLGYAVGTYLGIAVGLWL